MGLVTLIFDLLTLKLVRELHQRWGTFPGHARPLGSRIIRYVRDRRTDRQKQRLLPLPYGWGHNNTMYSTVATVYRKRSVVYTLITLVADRGEAVTRTVCSGAHT